MSLVRSHAPLQRSLDLPRVGFALIVVDQAASQILGPAGVSRRAGRGLLRQRRGAGHRDGHIDSDWLNGLALAR